MASLETQPPELLLSILCEFDSLVDLHSSISASPRCLHIFLANRSNVFWAVLQQAIHPAAFNLAIAAVSAPVVPVTAYPRERDDILSNFLRPLMSGDTEFFTGITKSVDIIKLTKLHASVERLSREYIQEAIPAFAACCDPVLNKDCNDLNEPTPEINDDESRGGMEQMHIKISETERGRLQTALYLYEVYCRAFDYSSNGHAVPTSTQCDLFIRYLQSWEFEQLASLLYFFVSRLAHHLELIQRQFVEDVRRNAVMEDFKMTRTPGWMSRHVRIPHLGEETFEDFHGGYFGSFSSTRYGNLCALACHGLGFLGEVMNPQTSLERRTELLLTTGGLQGRRGLGRRSLDSALETTSRMRSSHLRLDVFPLKSTGQGGSIVPNKFFDKHTKTELWKMTKIMEPKRLGLRATGCGFWDTSRIDHDEVHEQLWKTTERGPSYLERFLPIQCLGADMMVVGLYVPNATWGMLNAKYNSRRFETAVRHFSEGEFDLQRGYEEAWARAAIGWWSENDRGRFFAWDGGWISAPEYSRQQKEEQERAQERQASKSKTDLISAVESRET